MTSSPIRSGTRSSKVIAVAVGGSGLLGAAVIAFSPNLIATSSAVAVATGLVIYTVIAVAGLLLVRAPWSRWLGLLVAASAVVAGVLTDSGATGWITVGVSLMAIAGLSGPWLKVWLRSQPAASDLGWQPPTMILGAIALTPLVGLAAPEGLSLAHGALAGSGLLFGWGYARAGLWGLWGLRIGVLPLAVFTIPVSPLPGAAMLVTWSAGLTAIAWTRGARHAIGSVAPVLPSPRPPRSGEAR